MKLILILRSEDKQTADSPCEEIRIWVEIEKEAKAFRSKNAKHSVPKTFRSVPKAFCSVLEAFRFVQIVQRSHGVVIRFRVCTLSTIIKKIFIQTFSSMIKGKIPYLEYLVKKDTGCPLQRYYKTNRECRRPCYLRKIKTPLVFTEVLQDKQSVGDLVT